MRCVLHAVRTSESPVGIWWEDEAGGETRCFYLPSAGAERVIGAQVMSQKSEDAKWQEYFDFLVQGAFFLNGWEDVDVSEPPDKYLQRLGRLRLSA